MHARVCVRALLCCRVATHQFDGHGNVPPPRRGQIIRDALRRQGPQMQALLGKISNNTDARVGRRERIKYDQECREIEQEVYDIFDELSDSEEKQDLCIDDADEDFEFPGISK